MNQLYTFSLIKLILCPFCLMIGTELLRAADTTKPEAEEIPKTFQLDFHLQMCLGLYDGHYIILC